jgi:hypothetical protein
MKPTIWLFLISAIFCGLASVTHGWVTDVCLATSGLASMTLIIRNWRYLDSVGRGR